MASDRGGRESDGQTGLRPFPSIKVIAVDLLMLEMNQVPASGNGRTNGGFRSLLGETLMDKSIPAPLPELSTPFTQNLPAGTSVS